MSVGIMPEATAWTQKLRVFLVLKRDKKAGHPYPASCFLVADNLQFSYFSCYLMQQKALNEKTTRTHEAP
jgi:hypothetical protein